MRLHHQYLHAESEPNPGQRSCRSENRMMFLFLSLRQSIYLVRILMSPANTNAPEPSHWRGKGNVLPEPSHRQVAALSRECAKEKQID